MKPVSKEADAVSTERPVTMSALARQLGVSKATVSRALAGSPRVPAATRARIVDAARTAGWRPDARLKYLSALRWRGRASSECVIAWLCDRFTVLHPAKRRALGVHAARLGYRVEYWRLDERGSRDVARRLRSCGVRGILVDLHQNDVVPALPWEDYSAIVMGEEHPHLRLHRVATDWPQAFDLFRARVLDHGHRRVLVAARHFMGEGLSREIARAARGAQAELQAASVDCDLEFFDAESEEPGGALDRCLRRGGWDAVLTCTPAATEVARRTRRGRNPPAVFGLMQDALPDVPRFAGIDIQLGRRARVALDLLHLQLLQDRVGPAEYPVRHLLGARWAVPAG